MNLVEVASADDGEPGPGLNFVDVASADETIIHVLANDVLASACDSHRGVIPLDSIVQAAADGAVCGAVRIAVSATDAGGELVAFDRVEGTPGDDCALSVRANQILITAADGGIHTVDINPVELSAADRRIVTLRPVAVSAAHKRAFAQGLVSSAASDY